MGSRAPWRERSWAKVSSQVGGMAGSISEGTEKKGEYWPQRCDVLAWHWKPSLGVSQPAGGFSTTFLWGVRGDG